MRNPSMEAAVRRRFAALQALLNERERRCWAAAEAKAVGYGGVSMVARGTGVSLRAIHAGLHELAKKAPSGQRIRRPGGGRKTLTATQPDLKNALDALVEPTSRGDPRSSLRWTCKSVRTLADETVRKGYQIGRQKVCELLHELGYSLQANRKTRGG